MNPPKPASSVENSLNKYVKNGNNRMIRNTVNIELQWGLHG